MRNIKKLLSLLLICSMMLAMTGCSDTASLQKQDGKLKVVATVFAEYDFLRNIAGDVIDLQMLMLPGVDLHTYDPAPKDMKMVHNADLFVTIGGESDAWADKIIDSVDNDKLQTIRLMDCVKVVREEVVEGMQTEEEDHDHDHAEEATSEEHSKEEKEFDEHVWTSPKNAIQIVQKLCDKLSKMDAKHASVYQSNTKKYIAKLKKLDEAFTKVIENGKRREIIVADRFPFRYFADAYNLKYYAAFPGCSTQTGASAETIAFLIDKVKQDKIPVVFHMELSSELMCNTICEETGAKKAQLNAVHNISKQDFDKGIGYLELMQHNVKVLKEALNE